MKNYEICLCLLANNMLDIGYHCHTKADKGNKINGVYFLFNDDEIVYVGQSCDIKSRLQTHKRDPNKKFNSVKIMQFACTDRATAFAISIIESFFIHYLSPSHNYIMANGVLSAPYNMNAIMNIMD